MHPVLFHLGSVYIPSYGAIAALGVLLALLLAQRLAPVAGVAAQQVWNLSILALCAALVSMRLLLILVNWRDLLKHPLWMLGLAMIHNPLLAAAGALAGFFAALIYAIRHHLPLRRTADVLAAPITLAFACEQLGALLAGSGFGLPSRVPWAVLYTSPLAARWSGAPLDVPLHPVQAYAAFGLLTLSIALMAMVFLPMRAGDAAGVGLLGGGVVVFVTECWRDWSGRGVVLHGALDAPQIAAIGMVLLGVAMLREWHRKEERNG